MKTLLPFLLLCASALVLSAETEERIDRRFTVASRGQLVVDVGLGSIDVTAAPTDEVVISVFRKVSRRTKDAEEAFLREHPTTFSQDGDTVTLHSPRDSSTGGWWWFGVARTEAHYAITVPASCDIRLKTSGGGIAVSDLTGAVQAGTSGGALKFVRVTGPIDGHTSGGSIEVADCAGPVRIGTSGGGIRVSGGSGTLDGATSGGSVTVKDFRGPARVGTSGGSITIQNVSGQVRGTTSGGSITALFSTPLTDEVRLETSGGGVTVRLAEGSAFNLDAATSGGGVSTDLPVLVVGKVARDHLSGPVKGGDQAVVLRSGGGSIRVQKL